MAEVDAIVMEVNMFHPRGDVANPDFTDIFITMRELGFSVYDFLSYQTRPRDNALGYVDLAFVHTNGELRASHIWA